MLRLDLEKIGKTRREVFEEMRSLKIGVHVHYIPLHLLPFYRDRFGYKRGDYPESERYYDTVLTIPLYHGMSEEDADRVIQSVMKVVNEKVHIGAAQ